VTTEFKINELRDSIQGKPHLYSDIIPSKRNIKLSKIRTNLVSNRAGCRSGNALSSYLRDLCSNLGRNIRQD
jgi:hypothetical protein